MRYILYRSTSQTVCGEDDVPGTQGIKEWLLRLAGQA